MCRSFNQWGLKEEAPKVNLQEIIQKEKHEEEEKKAKEMEERQQKADEEMMRLVIEMSIKDYEDEQKIREEERKKNEPPKNALAKSLASAGALSKYSKEGFVPKFLKKEPDTIVHQENVSENQQYDYGYEEEYFPQR